MYGDDTEKVTWLIGLISALIVFVIIVPYFVIQFYFIRKYNDTKLFQNREGKFLKYQTFWFIIICLERGWVFLSMNDVFITFDNSMGTFNFGVFNYYFDRLIYCISIHVFIYLVTLRYWILHYNIVYNKSFQNAKWKSIIDKTHTDKMIELELCYLKNKQKYGNSKYVFKIICIVVSCTITTSYSSFIVSFHTLGLPYSDIIFFCVDALLALGPCLIIAVYIVRNTPVYHDIFLIRDEVKSYGKVVIFTFVFYLTIIGTTDTLVSQAWVLSFNAWVSVILGITIHHISIYWLRKHFLKMKRISSIQSDKRKDINITECLSGNDGVEAFMAHLIEQYSQENLLAYIELYQFKIHHETTLLDIVRHNSDDETKKGKSNPDDEGILYHILGTYQKTPLTNPPANDTLLRHPILPKTIPQSSIVFNIESNIDCKLKSLINKYILLDSHFVLNIDTNIRENIVTKSNNQFNELTLFEKVYIFEDTLSELLYMMNSSFQSFIDTDEYRRLCNITNTESKN